MSQRSFISCLTLIIALFFSVPAFGQDFEVPDYTLEKKEDYAKYKNDVLNCIEWLSQTPPNKQIPKRKEATAFFIKWVEGSPSVSIELHEYVMDIAGDNGELLVMFMAGWTKYELENTAALKSKDPGQIISKHLAGTKNMLAYYEQHKKNGLKKNKTAEKLLKMDDAELKSWLKGKVLM